MADKEKNVTTVSNEDKNFIGALMSLSPESKMCVKCFVKGILAGIDIKDKQAGAV